MAPIGYVASPTCSSWSTRRRRSAPRRCRFCGRCSSSASACCSSSCWAARCDRPATRRTPLRLGVWLTVLNITFNVVLITRRRPVPCDGHAGRGDRDGDRQRHRVGGSDVDDPARPARRSISRDRCRGSRTGTIIRSLFRFGLPAGIQGVAMNIGGVLLLRFIGSLQAQRRSAGGLRRRLCGAVFADHLDVGWADGRRGGGCRTEPRRRPSGAQRCAPCTSPRGSVCASRRSSARCSC